MVKEEGRPARLKIKPRQTEHKPLKTTGNKLAQKQWAAAFIYIKGGKDNAAFYCHSFRSVY